MMKDKEIDDEEGSHDAIDNSTGRE